MEASADSSRLAPSAAVLAAITGSHAHTPSNARYWVLDDTGELCCYPHEEAWARGEAARIRLSMAKHAVLRVYDVNALPCIALLPADVLVEGADPTADRRSWYLCGWPAALETSNVTDEWFVKLKATSALKHT